MKRALVTALLALVWLGIATGPVAAMSFPSAELRVEAFALTAVEQAELGDLPGAMETIALAMETAEVIPIDDERADALGWVAWAQVKVGDTAGAFETLGRVEDPYGADALVRAASALLDVGDLAGAKEAAWRAIEHLRSQSRSGLFKLMAPYWVLSQAGDLGALREAAMSSTSRGERSLAWSATALSQAASGDSAGAEESLAMAHAVAEKMEANSDRNSAFVFGVWAQAMMGDAKGAIEWIRDMVVREPDAAGLLLAAAAGAVAGSPGTAHLALDEMERTGWLGLYVVAMTEEVAQDAGREGTAGVRVVRRSKQGFWRATSSCTLAVIA